MKQHLLCTATAKYLCSNILFNLQVAIDASMSIYQFLIAVRSEGNQLQNEAGETTSHLMGMFYRTVRMVDNGIKPVYVTACPILTSAVTFACLLMAYEDIFNHHNIMHLSHDFPCVDFCLQIRL